jgi:hypothetical protein
MPFIRKFFARSKGIIAILMLMAIAISIPMAEATPLERTNAATSAPASVEGAHVNVVAQWNESKAQVGRYQAPQGYMIKSAVPRVQSASRASYNTIVSADKREATLAVNVRGSGEFWNKERGWFDGYLQFDLQPMP